MKAGGIREILAAKMGGGEVMPDPPEENNPVITNKLRKDWNDYVSFLESKGMKGKPELDKDGLGFKMIDEYRKVNPNTLVSKETIIPIQKEFQNYRNWSLDQIKQGKAKLAEGVTPENYMRALSIIDGIPGQRTTSFRFPESYLTTFNDGKNMGTVNHGFVTPSK